MAIGLLIRHAVGGVITIHDTPNLPATAPKRGEKIALPIGILLLCADDGLSG